VNSKSLTILISSVILIAVLALAVFINHRESLLLDGKVQISSLERPAKVYFDQLDVPYIEACSEKDLTIAQGFTTASQRLFQMDMLRRIAKGETAAIFGNSCLANDKLARIIGFNRIAEAEYPLLLPETKNWLKAYCQGVNSYISQSTLPLEFILLGYEPQPWQPKDTLAILKYLQYASDECWQITVLQNAIAQKGGVELAKQLFGPSLKSSQLATSIPNTEKQSSDSSYVPTGEQDAKPKESALDSQRYDLRRPTLNQVGWQKKYDSLTMPLYNLISTLPSPAQLSWGSHAWAISEEMSQSERALLACDKDTLFNFPDLFFVSSLRTPFIHVAGLTIPGVPGILIGRNDSFSWGTVNLKTQSQELCVEAFSNKITNQYSNKQGVFQAKEIQEEIPSRFAPIRMETISLTKDGPLLTKNGKIGIALNWYGSNPANNIIDSILPLNKAKNWSDFTNALEKYRGSLQAFLYADTTGNIGKYITGYNRHFGETLRLNQKEQDQQNSDAQASPKFIVATEGQIYPTSSAESTIPLVSSGSTWSALRAKKILAKSQTTNAKLSLENMIAMQADAKAPLSELVTKMVSDAIISTKNADIYQHDALTMLGNWDGQLKADSAPATIYESFITYITKKILQAKIGEQLSTEYMNKWPYWTQFTATILTKQPANILPITQHDFSIFSLDCLSQSLKNLRLIFQTSPVSNSLNKMQWQKLHQLDFRSNLARFIPANLINAFSPIFPGAIGIDADQDCLNACNYQISNESPLYICNSGPTARLLIDMADNDKFYHSLTFGQSGHLFSKDRMYNGQLKSWRKMEFHAMAFSSNQLGRTARHILFLDNTVE